MTDRIAHRQRGWIGLVVIWLALAGLVPAMVTAQGATPQAVEAHAPELDQGDEALVETPVTAIEPAAPVLPAATELPTVPAPTAAAPIEETVETEAPAGMSAARIQDAPETESIQPLRLDSGTPDPNATVDIVNLTVDCDGSASFTTVVNVTYPRFEGHVIFDIYNGDPDAGGELMIVFSPFEGLPGGSTYWSDELGALFTNRIDPYIHVRWVLMAWTSNSGLDYVGEWRGSEKAAPVGCQTPPTQTPPTQTPRTPTPVATAPPAPTPTPAPPTSIEALVAEIIRILIQILATFGPR